ncbi:cytochrome c, partial [Candidatus Sumerlaeota bacterium]|nr:cytochrome c [Candidatus Sumerlaeota bacterium]
MTIRLFSVIGAAILAASLCAAAHADDDQTPVTYSKQVATIFQKYCQDCHHPGDIGPMSLMTYQEARPWAKSIRKAVAERKMPHFHAEKGKFAFANDISMSEPDIQTIVRWVDGGAPEGNPADLPPARQFDSEGWKSGTPDLVLEPFADYNLGAGINDEYRCFVLPSTL